LSDSNPPVQAYLGHCFDVVDLFFRLVPELFEVRVWDDDLLP
jgi:hypothetical protein